MEETETRSDQVRHGAVTQAEAREEHVGDGDRRRSMHPHAVIAPAWARDQQLLDAEKAASGAGMPLSGLLRLLILHGICITRDSQRSS